MAIAASRSINNKQHLIPSTFMSSGLWCVCLRRPQSTSRQASGFLSSSSWAQSAMTTSCSLYIYLRVRHFWVSDYALLLRRPRRSQPKNRGPWRIYKCGSNRTTLALGLIWQLSAVCEVGCIRNHSEKSMKEPRIIKRGGDHPVFD
jgi:hypothetical protein